jgi:hypothetical protein
MDAPTKTDPVATAIAQLADAIRETNTFHSLNAVTIMIALIEKGILSPNDVQAARVVATSFVDQEQARIRDEEQLESLRAAVERFSRGRK